MLIQEVGRFFCLISAIDNPCQATRINFNCQRITLSRQSEVSYELERGGTQSISTIHHIRSSSCHTLACQCLWPLWVSDSRDPLSCSAPVSGQGKNTAFLFSQPTNWIYRKTLKSSIVVIDQKQQRQQRPPLATTTAAPHKVNSQSATKSVESLSILLFTLLATFPPFHAATAAAQERQEDKSTGDTITTSDIPCYRATLVKRRGRQCNCSHSPARTIKKQEQKAAEYNQLSVSLSRISWMWCGGKLRGATFSRAVKSMTTF